MYTPLEKFVGRTLTRDHKENIHVKEKNDMFLYNYGNMVIVPRNDPILMKCRGLILNKDGTVLNYPFDRFFNPYEDGAADLDWDSTVILEKLDGSLICVFFTHDWEVTTRGSFYPNQYPGLDFAKKFKSLFVSFDKLNRKYCYMFEMMSNENRVVTWYNEEFVVLVGARNLTTLKEVSQVELDKIAIELGVRRPKKYDGNNIDQCKKLFESLEDDEEGFVMVDENSNRLKIKQESYLKMMKIKMLKEDDLLDYVRGKIEVDGELLQRDVNVVKRVGEIRHEWTCVKNIIDKTFSELNVFETRKEFALASLKFPFHKFLFTMKDNRSIKDVRLRYEELIDWHKKIISNNHDL